MVTVITDRPAEPVVVDEPAPPRSRTRRILPGLRAAPRRLALRGAQTPRTPTPAGVALASTALGIVAALALTFVAELTFAGDLQHNRNQITAADALRADLANATAPVGPLDDSGRLLQEGRPVAILEIPELGLSEVVGEGTASGVTMAGPGHRRDSVFPGQAGLSVIAGRSSAFGAPFALLGTLRPGARISTTTGQGKADYAVTSVRRAGDPMPQPLASGAARLLLVTADGPRYQPTGAVMVDAQAVTTPFQAPPQLRASVLEPQERVMAGDTSTANFFALVLWSQLLLALAVAMTWTAVVWGRWPTWLVGAPTLLAVGLAVAQHVCRLLPNIL